MKTVEEEKRRRGRRRRRMGCRPSTFPKRMSNLKKVKMRQLVYS